MNKTQMDYIYIYVSDFTERYYCGGVYGSSPSEKGVILWKRPVKNSLPL